VTSLVFAPISVAGRINDVRRKLDSLGCDVLVVTNLVNIRWCTGFTGSSGALVITPRSAALITDSRYRDQAADELERAGCEAEVEISQRTVESGSARIPKGLRVGFESESITWSQQQEWARAISTTPRAIVDLVLGLRSVKTDAEVERIEAAAAIVDESLADVGEMIVPGTTERRLALAIDDGMRQRGASGPAYETIVATGSNSALPHATPGDRALASGDLLVIDAGALVDGYRSDMTRTFVVGGGSSGSKVDEILSLVLEAQQAGVDSVMAGIEAGTVDHACRSIIDDAGHGADFGHGTGHGVGLDIHELPAVRQGNAAILQPGHVLTVEPGIYVSDLGGVRIEDTVVVTHDGCRVLTRFPKHPST